MLNTSAKIIAGIILASLLTIGWLVQPVAATTPASSATDEPVRILVKMNPSMQALNSEAMVATHPADAGSLAPIGWEILEIDADLVPAVLAQLAADARTAEVDHPLELAWTPNDPGVAGDTQWALQKIGAEIAWEFSSGKAITVAVLDSGIDATHPDLIGRVVTGHNFYDDNTDTTDLCGHGTHVAGIIAATANNAVGIAGVAHNAKIMPLKVIDDDCVGSYIRLMQAIVYATDIGVRLISITSGGGYEHEGLHEAIQYAESRGVLVVVSAGNRANHEPFFPGSFPESFTVAGTNRDDEQYDKSNYGDQIDISAPATAVYSTYFDDNQSTYAYMTGTSMATPHVVGVAALLLERDPSMSLSDLKTLLLASTVDLGEPGWDPIFGAGRISAWRGFAQNFPAAGNVKQGHIRVPAMRLSERIAVSATVQSDGIHLLWTQSEVASNQSVVLYRSAVYVFDAALDIAELPAAATGSYVDGSVEDGTRYSYWLVLAQENVELETSAQVSVTFTSTPEGPMEPETPETPVTPEEPAAPETPAQPVANQVFIPMVQRVN